MVVNSGKRYAEVWGDTVVLKELLLSSVIGIILTMTGYLLGARLFVGNPNIEPSLAKGYSLMVGIGGCIIAAVIAANLFKPKRVVEEHFEQEDIKAVLEAAGYTLEEEAMAIAAADPDIIAELEDLNLTALLDLRPLGEKLLKEKK